MRGDLRFLTRAWRDWRGGVEAGLPSVVSVTRLREVRFAFPFALEMPLGGRFTALDGRAGALLRDADLVARAGALRSEREGIKERLALENSSRKEL